MSEQITLAAFIADHKIEMTAERTDQNPNMDDQDRAMDHWRVTLRRNGADRRSRMTIIFSMGLGHHGKMPTAADVLDCLSSDSSCVRDDFEEFCANLGYDSDSRKAERIYKACQRAAAKLEKFLGSEAFEQLLNNVERL